MQRLRSILGLLAGAFMILSSAAHSLLGWKALSAALRQSQAPEDLITSLGIGWHFAGFAMLGFGCILVAVFVRRLRGAAVSPTPAIVIGVTYVAFSVWALAVGEFDPFFLVFLVPGLMALIASAPGGKS